MRDWRDLNGDGSIDGVEMMFADEMLCTSREEHMSLFGNAGVFDEEEEEDEAGETLPSFEYIRNSKAIFERYKRMSFCAL